MAEYAELIAYRKLVAALPDLLSPEARQPICDWLIERQVMRDGQEDPGAVIVEGLETELAFAETFRKIVDSLECRPR